jgi:hypothetical protein
MCFLRCEAKIDVTAVCIIVFVGICVIAVLLRRKFTKAVARLGSCNLKGETIATRASQGRKGLMSLP